LCCIKQPPTWISYPITANLLTNSVCRYNSDLHLLSGADDISREAMIVHKHFEMGEFQMQIVSFEENV
jgi:hypothetical protein